MRSAMSTDHEPRIGSMQHSSPIVFIVDDDVSVRESLQGLLDNAGWRVETFSSAREFLARPRQLTPSCLVLDVTLPDLNGLELQQQIAGDRGDMPIIFITGYGDIPTSVKAMKAGAVEFLTKPISTDALLNAISQAIEHSGRTLRDQAERSILRDRYDSLTPRERDVMHLVVTGQLNKQAAGELGISEITVKAHRGKVMRKMQVGSLAELVNIAARLDVTK